MATSWCSTSIPRTTRPDVPRRRARSATVTRCFQAWGIAVLGCSIDSADSHKAFIKKYGLPFSLLLDPDRSIARAYGAENGVPILGLDRRVTYVIGEDGHILKVYPSVDPGIHAKQIIHDLGAEHPPSPTPAASPAASAEAPSPVVWAARAATGAGKGHHAG